jgi:hypothetical protein
LRELIRTMAAENPIRGEAGIAGELGLKLGIGIAPRPAGKYLSGGRCPVRASAPKPHWVAFIQNRARGIVACGFFVVVNPIRNHGSRGAEARASQRDSSSYSGLDAATAF